MSELGEKIIAGLKEFCEDMDANEAKPLKTYEFTIELRGAGELTTKMANALYEAGCDDATVSTSIGVLRIRFSRQAESLMDAVLSADAQVRKAVTSFKSIRFVAEDGG